MSDTCLTTPTSPGPLSVQYLKQVVLTVWWYIWGFGRSGFSSLSFFPFPSAFPRLIPFFFFCGYGFASRRVAHFLALVMTLYTHSTVHIIGSNPPHLLFLLLLEFVFLSVLLVLLVCTLYMQAKFNLTKVAEKRRREKKLKKRRSFSGSLVCRQNLLKRGYRDGGGG